MLYTDGTTPATTEQIKTALAESIAADKTAEREASAQVVQDYIDADAKLTDSGITAEADALDEACAVVQFNAAILSEATERGALNKGAYAMITQIGVGDKKRQTVAPLGFRATPAQCIAHLAQLSALLPSVA
jgi:hypothetical protein